MLRSIVRWLRGMSLKLTRLNLGLHRPWRLALFFALALHVPKLYKQSMRLNCCRRVSAAGKFSARRRLASKAATRWSQRPFKPWVSRARGFGHEPRPAIAFPASSAQRKLSAFEDIPLCPVLGSLRWGIGMEAGLCHSIGPVEGSGCSGGSGHSQRSCGGVRVGRSVSMVDPVTALLERSANTVSLQNRE
jgi:hypothetical protein